MNILVVGCGKVGSRLACSLSRAGHDVSIVDRNAEHFELLDDDFSGITVSGVPIDQDTLRHAGIEGCDAVAAVTQDDNINVMVSQLASEIFNVPKVLARIYDPQREDVFSHFGLRTVCPTKLTVEAVSSMLMDAGEMKNVTFDSADVSFSTIKVPKGYSGKRIHDIPSGENEAVFGVLHSDGSMSLVTKDNNFKIYDTDRLVIAKVI